MVALPKVTADFNPKYAGFWLRLGAMLVDFIILTFAYLGWMYIAVNLLAPNLPPDPEDREAAVALIRVIPPFAGILYYVALTASSWEGTLGKKLIGIKVTSVSGRRTGLLRSLVRFLVFFFIPAVGYLVLEPVAIPLYTIAMDADVMHMFGAVALLLAGIVLCFYLMAAFTRQKRALHDFIAGTLVLKE